MNFSVAKPMLKNKMQPHHRDLFDRMITALAPTS